MAVLARLAVVASAMATVIVKVAVAPAARPPLVQVTVPLRLAQPPVEET